MDATSAVFLSLFVVTLVYAGFITKKYVPSGPPMSFGFLGPVYDYITTWFSLFPYVFLLAGPFIDVITAQFMYTKASIVGIIGVLITGLFGSDKYAQLSEKLIGFLPTIRTEYPAGVFTTNWVGIGVWAAVLSIFVLVPLFVTSSFTNWSAGGALGIGLSSFLLVTLLAGNGWLGDIIPRTSNPSPPTSSFSTLSISNACTTPGLGCVQTSFAPVGILLNTSILTSHMWESLDTGNTEGVISSGALAAVAFLIEFMTLTTKSCQADYKYNLLSPVISLILGTGFGYGGYQMFKFISQETFTSSSTSGGIFHPPPGPITQTKTGKKDSTVPTSGDTEQCSSESDQFEDGDIALVGELFKDGEPITSNITVA